VGGEGRLVLAAQDVGDDRGKTAQNNAFGVDQDPFLVDVRRSDGKGFHHLSQRKRRQDAPGFSDGGLSPKAARRSMGTRNI
jgi:hypothetical protein